MNGMLAVAEVLGLLDWLPKAPTKWSPTPKA